MDYFMVGVQGGPFARVGTYTYAKLWTQVAYLAGLRKKRFRYIKGVWKRYCRRRTFGDDIQMGKGRVVGKMILVSTVVVMVK